MKSREESKKNLMENRSLNCQTEFVFIALYIVKQQILSFIDFFFNISTNSTIYPH